MQLQGLQILGRHSSYNVQKVLWLADELDLDYQHTELGGKYGGNDSPEFLKLNPMGKVPVLIDGDKSVWESNTILRYLADTRAVDVWISTNPYHRTQIDRWLDWSIDRFEPAFVGVFWGYYRTPVDQRDQASIEKSVGDCQHCLEVLAEQLNGHSGNKDKYLTGPHPTLADIATGVFLYRLDRIDLDIPFPPAVTEWYRQLCERPAYARWVKSDFSELSGRLAY